MTYESSRLAQTNGFPISYQSINTTCAEHTEERNELSLHQQATEKTSGARVCILLLTVVLSILTLSSVLLPLFTASHTKLDPLMTGFVGGPLSLSMVHRDATTSYYEVLDNSYDVINGHPVKRVLASGTYIRNAGGWNHLTVVAGKGYASSPSKRERSLVTSNNYVRALEAAGYLEGYSTCVEILQFYNNFYFGLFDGGDPTRDALMYLEENHRWMASEAEKNWQTSDYWMAVKGLVAQLHGLLAGIQAGCPGFEPIAGDGNMGAGIGVGFMDAGNLGAGSGGDPVDGMEGPSDTTHYNGVYLPAMSRGPSLIHVLLLNANGDLYQIADKFSQSSSLPTTDDYDDGIDEPFSDGSDGTPAPPVDGKIDTTTTVNTTTSNGGSGSGSSSPSAINRNGQGLRGRLRRAKHFHNGGIGPGQGARSEGVDHCSVLIKLVRQQQSPGTVQQQGQEQGQPPQRKQRRRQQQQQGIDPGSATASGDRPIGLAAGSGGRVDQVSDEEGEVFDVLVGHNTWDDYQNMGPRIYKRYSLPLITGFVVPKLEPNSSSQSRRRTTVSSREGGRGHGRGHGHGDRQRRRRLQDTTHNNDQDINNGNDQGQGQGKGPDGGDGNDDGRDDDDLVDSLGQKERSRLEMHFSSSPGLLSSLDDFFTLQGRARLIVTETTMDLYNDALLDAIHSSTLHSWVRVRLANQLASSGVEWAEVFSMYHSGTYANQWMVLDLDRFRGRPSSGTSPSSSSPASSSAASSTFTAQSLHHHNHTGNNPHSTMTVTSQTPRLLRGKIDQTTTATKPQLLSGFLTVLEEIPGFIHSADMTIHLVHEGYWASYNNPFFSDIANVSGNAILCQMNSNTCYDNDPRANIFREHQSKVKDLAGMQRMIAYNNFEKDLLALNDSCNAIACRQDLEPDPSLRYPFGAIDGKVTGIRMLLDAMATELEMDKTQPLPHSTTQPQESHSTSPSQSQRIRKTSARGLLSSSMRPIHAYARLGPSHDHQPPFCWKQFLERYPYDKRGKLFKHAGQPDCFDFDWQPMPPSM